MQLELADIVGFVEMGAVSQVKEKDVATVVAYVAARQKKAHGEVLELVSDDIDYYSQRDGSFQGKKEFEVYLKKTKVEGEWEEPRIEDGDEAHVVVRGVVKIMWIPISVKSTFSINEQGKICKIHTGKA